MPVLFVGHGSPMNVIEDNRWSRGFRSLSNLVPAPRAVLAISAHWYVDGSYLTAAEMPRTIHDFSGFPPALYELEYPASGDPGLVEAVRDRLGEERVGLSVDWGLDHGTWSVLHWMIPDASVPVVQLSIDRRLAPREHVEIGRAIADLREEGVLILASGNIVHNLHDAVGRMRSGVATTPDWAARFDTLAAEALVARDTATLLGLWPDTEDGRRAHPTPDHWLPLLYAYGASSDADRVSFPAEGFDLGSLSMRSVLFA